MSEYQRPRTEAEFSNNFSQIHPLMNDTQAHYESSRCLFCYDAPCIKACPTGIDIPLFIKQINTGNTNGAATTIYQSNWLGNICGKVCPTEVLCEGACVYNLQQVKPIEIGRLQSYATTQVVEQHKKLFQAQPQRNQKIAVVGAGPAGIAVACELSMLGYSVKIYEAKEHPSGLALYGVAPYKIENEDIIKEINFLQDQFKFDIEYNSPIDSQEKFKDLEQNYAAIFLGIGLGATRSLGLKGEDLPGSWGAVEFIETLKIQHHRLVLGRQIVILGGGNTAMDAASEAARMGAEEVILAYRKGPDEMRAYDFEFKLAKSVGVKSLWNASPVEIQGKDEITGVKFISTKMENGRLQEIDGSEFVIPCQMLIRATGQNKQEQLLKFISGMETDENGKILEGALKFQTRNPQYFSGGDALNGGLEVVNAVAEAKKAAHSIQQYLSDKI